MTTQRPIHNQPCRAGTRDATQQGFTLIELVVTLTISAIMAIGVISYIGDAVDGFSASSSRSKLAASGRVAVDRMAAELYNAVPNSLRVSPDGQCLEFLPVLAATTYIDPAFEAENQTFDAVAPASADYSDVAYAIIFPIDAAGLYHANSTGSLARVDSIGPGEESDGDVITVDLAAPHKFERRSPVNRLYLASEPVSFCVTDNLLFRYHGYGQEYTGPSATQCTPATCLPDQLPQRVLISGPLNNTGLATFRVEPATLRRNALAAIHLNFSESGDIVNLRHEVMIRNVP